MRLYPKANRVQDPVPEKAGVDADPAGKNPERDEDKEDVRARVKETSADKDRAEIRKAENDI